jgi:enterochelin esterase-like enzyme
VCFRMPDPDRRFAAVALCQELVRPRVGPPLRWERGVWAARFPRGGAARMEYELELRHAGGGTERVPDPTNPCRVPGPFGERSEIRFPGYRPPAWVDGADEGETAPAPIGVRSLRLELEARVWSSPGARPGEPLPLLVAHDGPDYARFARLPAFLSREVGAGRLPPHRLALLPGPDRDEHLSASARYARALAREIVPALERFAPSPGRDGRVALGASLGALAALHVHRLHPGTFGALFLQSGSFFRPRLDRHESGFPRFGRIARFVGTVVRAERFAAPVPVIFTCGTVEENLANNRVVAAALHRQGYPVRLHEHPDAHNWISWRDTFDPHLGRFLATAWEGFRRDV